MHECTVCQHDNLRGAPPKVAVLQQNTHDVAPRPAVPPKVVLLAKLMRNFAAVCAGAAACNFCSMAKIFPD